MQFAAALVGAGLEVGQHFGDEMGAGPGPRGFIGEQFRRHGAADHDAVTPGAFVQDGAGNEFGLMAMCQAYGAGGHLHGPAVAEGDVELPAFGPVKGDEQEVAGGEEPGGFLQLVHFENDGDVGAGDEVFGEEVEFPGFAGFSAGHGGAGDAVGAEPVAGEVDGAKMTEGQDGGVAGDAELAQLLVADEGAAVAPFGIGQAVGKIHQMAVHVELQAPPAKLVPGPGGLQAGGQGLARAGVSEGSVQGGAGEGEGA